MSKTHRILLISILLFIFAAPAFAEPLFEMVPPPNELVFSVVGAGGEIIEFDITTFGDSNPFWSVFLVATESPGPPSDEIVITGIIRHIVSPVGHNDGPGLQLPFMIGVNSANATFMGGNLGTVQATQVFSIVHGPDQHLDLLMATLTATVTRVMGEAPFNITSWELAIDVVHTPEPATMALLGMGLAGVAMKIRGSRRSKKIS